MSGETEEQTKLANALKDFKIGKSTKDIKIISRVMLLTSHTARAKRKNILNVTVQDFKDYIDETETDALLKINYITTSVLEMAESFLEQYD